MFVVFFYSGRIKTLVAMAIYSFHRLIMGKLKLTITAESMGIFEISIYRNVYLEVLHVSFDFCPNRLI